MGGVSEEYLNSCVTLNSLVRIYHVKTSKTFSAEEEKKIYLDAARNEVEMPEIPEHMHAHTYPRTCAVFSLYLSPFVSLLQPSTHAQLARIHTPHHTHINTHTHPRTSGGRLQYILRKKLGAERG